MLPQFSPDRHSSKLLHNGPEGGLMGTHTGLLWRISGETPSLATDPDMLLLATQLVQVRWWWCVCVQRGCE